MITVLRRAETVQGVAFQIGRSSAPDRPIMISIDGVLANLTTREASDMASVGAKIRILLHKAKKRGGMPDDRRLMAGALAGVEFAIGISCKGEVPGVDLQIDGRSFRFVDTDITKFCAVLAQLDTALSEHRGARPGGSVQQLLVAPMRFLEAVIRNWNGWNNGNGARAIKFRGGRARKRFSCPVRALE